MRHAMTVLVWAMMWPSLVIVPYAMLSAAQAHEWYPADCCEQRDCYHAEDWEVELREGGYWIVEDHILIPFDDPIVRDGNVGEGFHLCRNYKNHGNIMNCIFPPGPGF